MSRSVVFFLSSLCPALAQATLGEIKADTARADRDSQLYSGPGESFGKSSADVVTGEALLLYGLSSGGHWIKVLKRDGQSGWIPRNRLELTPIESEEREELHKTDALTRRLTSRWILNLGGVYGTSPLNGGLSIQPFFNLAKEGLLGIKVDQVEMGVGFSYHYSTHADRYFWEVPVSLQWIFRPRFSNYFMWGVRAGFSVIHDPTFRFDNAIPFQGGLHARYYFGDVLGIYADALTMLRSKKYVYGGLGLSARFE